MEKTISFKNLTQERVDLYEFENKLRDTFDAMVDKVSKKITATQRNVDE